VLRPAGLGVLVAAVAITGCGEANRQTADKTPALVRRIQPRVVEIIVENGLGSGVIWDARGAIVTNDHVVEGSKTIQVVFANGTRVHGRVRAADKLSDLAVVEVDRNGLPAAKFTSTLPQVGAYALAIGAPFGYERSVSAGIISGVHRSLPPERGKLDQYVDLIQTDAPISPGNSGGALVNSKGDVVGINTAVVPPTLGASNIGFAIPSTTVRDVVGDLLQGRRVNHPYFGARAVDLWPELVRAFHTKAESGALILEVRPNSPAQDAGIVPGDTVSSVDGKKTRNAEEFLAALRHKAPGQKVMIGITTYANTSQSVAVTLSDQAKPH
jgi:serine protease DegQ